MFIWTIGDGVPDDVSILPTSAVALLLLWFQNTAAQSTTDIIIIVNFNAAAVLIRDLLFLFQLTRCVLFFFSLSASQFILKMIRRQTKRY